MRQNDVCLLIHHHHVAFIDEDGVIWLSSVIGRWVDALSDCLGEVILLFYQSEQRLPQQDTPVARKNVRLYSLGARRTVGNRIFRQNRLRQVCNEAGRTAVGLINGMKHLVDWYRAKRDWAKGV